MPNVIDVETYDLGLVLIGALCLAAVTVPVLLRNRLMTFPLLVVAAGAGIAALPLPLPAIDPIADGFAAEHLSEFAVIVALTALGLKIDRAISWRGWRITWRLLAITMPLTIAATAALGYAVLGLAPAAALLLGACIAPTDPVLAGDVQTGPPSIGDPDADEPDEVRFALTSESALNDGLAFPFTNLAILVALFGLDPTRWWGRFVLVEVGYKIAAALVLGWLVGRLLGHLVLRMTNYGTPSRGLFALAITLLGYGITELAGGYGFIAVFVTAYVIRATERTHHVHDDLHDGADQLERLAMGVVLLLFGAAITEGLLGATTPMVLLTAALLVIVVRPMTGWLGLLGHTSARRDEQIVIALFGIRGLGSFYYLAHGLNEAPFADAATLWAVVSWTVLFSLVSHGLGASKTMAWLDRRRMRDAP